MQDTIATTEITDISVSVEKAAGGYDFSVTLNGKTTMIGFALKVAGVPGYGFNALTLTQFPEALGEQTRLLEVFTKDAQEAGYGLTLAEVRKRAAILAGIWLAGKTLELV